MTWTHRPALMTCRQAAPAAALKAKLQSGSRLDARRETVGQDGVGPLLEQEPPSWRACKGTLCWILGLLPLDGLVVRGFYDVVFEPGTAFGKEAVGQHLARPLNGQISREDPDIR